MKKVTLFLSWLSQITTHISFEPNLKKKKLQQLEMIISQVLMLQLLQLKLLMLVILPVKPIALAEEEQLLVILVLG